MTDQWLQCTFNWIDQVNSKLIWFQLPKHAHEKGHDITPLLVPFFDNSQSSRGRSANPTIIWPPLLAMPFAYLLLLTEEAGFWKDLKKFLHFYEFSHLIRFLSLCHWELNVLFVQSNHLIHLLNKLIRLLAMVFCFQNCFVRILFVNSRPSVLNL